MSSHQIVLACALMACTAALYVDYSKKPSDAPTYDGANTKQYNNQYKNKDTYTNQYNNADYNNQYKNKDAYNNQYNNKDEYNNQYKNKDTYNNQYKNKDASNYQYSNADNNNQYKNKDTYNNADYNNENKNKDIYNNQYNNADYNNQYKNKDAYNNQYNNKDDYNNQYNNKDANNNQYKNKDAYNKQYNNGKQYNTIYNNQANYQQNSYDSQVGVYTCRKGDEGKKYEVVGACYAYYECVNGDALYRQCEDYYKYDAASGKCVADKSCKYGPAALPSDYSAKSYSNYANNNYQYNNDNQYDNDNNQYNKYNKNTQNSDNKYVQNDKYNNGNQYDNGKQYNANYNAPSTYQQSNSDSSVGVYTCGKGDEVKKYEVVGACYAYYECVYGEALYRQCDDYYKFDAYSGKCVADKSCQYVAAVVPSTYSGKKYTSYASGQANTFSYAKA